MFLSSDNKDLNIVSEKFTNIHKTCLSMLQHAAVDTNVVKVIKNLSISMLNACQDSMYQNCIDISNNNYSNNNYNAN